MQFRTITNYILHLHNLQPSQAWHCQYDKTLADRVNWGHTGKYATLCQGGPMCTNGIHRRVSIDTLDWHLDCYSMGHSIPDWHLGWQSSNFRLMHMSWSTLSWLSTHCWSSVNQVSTAYQLGCPSSNDPDVDRGYQSTLGRMPLGPLSTLDWHPILLPSVSVSWSWAKYFHIRPLQGNY